MHVGESPWSLSAGLGVWPIDEYGATATVWNPGGSVKRYRGHGKHRLFGTLGVGVVKMCYRLVERAPRNYEISDLWQHHRTSSLALVAARELHRRACAWMDGTEHLPSFDVVIDPRDFLRG